MDIFGDDWKRQGEARLKNQISKMAAYGFSREEIDRILSGADGTNSMSEKRVAASRALALCSLARGVKGADDPVKWLRLSAGYDDEWTFVEYMADGRFGEAAEIICGSHEAAVRASSGTIQEVAP